MAKTILRTPKNYDGTRVTTHRMQDLLPSMLSQIKEKCQGRPDLILLAWPEIIGPKLAPMTKALSLSEGVLLVAVNNSSLYSLLTRYEKPRILSALQQRFSKTLIKNVEFRIA